MFRHYLKSLESCKQPETYKQSTNSHFYILTNLQDYVFTDTYSGFMARILPIADIKVNVISLTCLSLGFDAHQL